jgi:3-hydroxy-9,10-secoandrosta-1,3,5(10)-triene-9,17-dione monooxygenase reductase component
MSEPQGRVHRDHPFRTPVELREPARRFRGRLASPVTVWTAGSPEERAGLTVSSLVVSEGEPPSVFGLVGTTTDLAEVVQRSEAFVVHVLEKKDRPLAERFALRHPSPGGVFRGLGVADSKWGPVLTALSNRVCCRCEDVTETGNHLLVRGAIEEIELGELSDPLVYFRGAYRGLPPEAD